MSTAKIDTRNGTPALEINGETFSLMAMTTRIKDEEYLRGLRKAGVRIFFIFANTDWLRPGKSLEESQDWREWGGFASFQSEAERLLRVVPDAYIIVRIGMHPPVSWMESHPDDLLRYSDGKTMPCVINSEVHYDRVPGCYSLCSEAWRKDGGEALMHFCDQVEHSPIADRVIGYFLGAGGTSEWYYVNQITEAGMNKYADVSPAFRREYGRILRERYGTEEKLRAAWKKDDATFENPGIPDLHEREYVDIDKLIIHSLVTFECADRIDYGVHYNNQEPTRKGVFLNVNGYRHVYDFFNAWHEGTANTMIHFARLLKQRDPDTLVGSFYGSLGCTDYYGSSTTTGTRKILNSGVVDFLAAPGVYNNRWPGGYVAQREVQDSFTLRKMLFLSEEDSRTHLDCDFYRDANNFFTIQDTLNTLKRDFARNLCENTFAWWFDQHQNGGRYKHEDIYKMMAVQQRVALEAAKHGKPKANEIAIIYDEESIHLVSKGVNRTMLDFYRTSDLGRIGAPVDYYFHDDLTNENMPDYKLYLMLNTFCLTNAEREAIRKKAAKNHATVVWFYAPGFVNFDRETPMDTANISELTGMQVNCINETHSVKFRITDPKHPALRYAVPDRFYGWIDREVCSTIWVGSVLDVPFLNPCFTIEEGEGVTVLGRYCIDGKPALAMKDTGDFVSIYCTTQILRAELLTSLAEYAGCHIYGYEDDCIYANENFVNIHAENTGRHVLHFRHKCSPYEIYEGKYYGKDIDTLALELYRGQTLTFSVNDQLSESLSK